MISYEFYAKSPVLFKNYIIFSTNNSLYKFDKELKTVENLLITNNEIKHLKISNDNLIFVSEFEGGPDLYIMNLNTKQVSRLSFTEDAFIKPIYFHNDQILFISSEYSAISSHQTNTYEINIQTKEIKKINYHSIFALTKDEDDIYTQKDEYGYLSWKNYRGGSRGKIYKNGELLIDLPGQAISPVFYKKRIYFIYEDNSDTNIYSCDTKGKDLIKHTNHKEFKLQGLEIKDNEIIYTQMGEIYVFNIEKNQTELIEINLKIQQPNKKQSLHTQYLTSIDNNEEKIICAIRGNLFEKNLYSGGLKQITSELRYVHTGFLNEKIFGIKEGRETELHIFENENIIKHKLASQKIEHIAVSTKGFIAFSNHKGELSIINEKGEQHLITQTVKPIDNFEWSKNGNWLVYELPKANSSAIVLFNLKEKYNYYVIDDEYQNTNPTIDPENNYIAFLSNRNLQIKMDEVKFDYNFDIKTNAFYVPLKENFNILKPWIIENKELKKTDPNQKEEENEKDKKEENQDQEELFELKNISDKISPLKINHKLEEIYALENQILGIISDEKRVVYNLKTLKEQIIQEKQEATIITNNKKSITTINENTVLISDINEKAEEDNWKTSKFDLTNKYSKTEIKKELENIFEELTWFMEEFFWSKEIIIDFKEKIQEYKKFLPRINTKAELYEILKQIQGEMKTSHSYIFQSYKTSNKGYLAIKTKEKENKIVIEDYIISTSKTKEHPLILENIKKGSQILKINGEETTKSNIEEQLLNQSNQHVSLIIESPEKEVKEYDIKTIDLSTHKKWNYENWIKQQEEYINSKNADIAYIHIKDMSSAGFINFFKKYISLHDKKAIIIDVRYNAGGHVSTLILEQLTKKRTGIDIPRHFAKHSIPNYTTNGNYVLLINENTASDGEIFAENFRQMKLGKIIGKRTWGGVVGIWPRYNLINNLTTSQPEFATIFFNAKQEIENHGVVPDIEIENSITEEITPQNDNQLNQAIEICNTFK